MEEAKRISETLVKEKWIACANLFPGVVSIYTWENNLEESSEVVGFFKTRKEHFKKLEKRITELHSYKVPCILQLAVSECSDGYKNWVLENTSTHQ